MCAAISAPKTEEELLAWGHADLPGLVDYTLGLQAELAALRDAHAQNSTNSSRPPSRSEEHTSELQSR